MLTQKDIDNAHRTLALIGLNDLTLRQESLDILTSASNTVKAILERRKTLDAQGYQDKPLIVLAGENHAQPSNYMQHIAVITQLTNKEKNTALMIEAPHDTLRKAYAEERHAHKSWPLLPKNFITDNGRNSALFQFSAPSSRLTPFSRNTLLHTCLKNNIAVKFTDAARDGAQKNLDLNDPSTRETVISCLGEHHTSPVSLVTPQGMWARNHHMAKNALKYAKKTGSRIIVQQTGVYHLAGIHEGYPDQSLSAEFKKAGAKICAYYLASQDEYVPAITKDAAIDKHDIVMLPPLPERQAIYDTDNDGTQAGAPELNTHEKESAYVNTILAEMRLAQYGLNTPTYKTLRKRRKQQINKQFAGWAKRLNSRP